MAEINIPDIDIENAGYLLLILIIFLIIGAYLIWPIDAIPDFLPVIGWIDDILVALGGLAINYQLAKETGLIGD